VTSLLSDDLDMQQLLV